MEKLNSGDFTEAADPLALFAEWLAEARACEPNDPEAMTLATVDAEGLPDARMVLCKGIDAHGLVFYTNAESAKGEELKSAPRAALLFHWKSLRRQVRWRGAIGPATEAESDAYFASRARASQIGAWASRQSRSLKNRAELEARAADYTAKFAGGDVPRPPHWRGFRLSPISVEFWADGLNRLHDRVVFQAVPDGWKRTRLFP